jgi:hypothetical protein
MGELETTANLGFETILALAPNGRFGTNGRAPETFNLLCNSSFWLDLHAGFRITPNTSDSRSKRFLQTIGGTNTPLKSGCQEFFLNYQKNLSIAEVGPSIHDWQRALPREGIPHPLKRVAGF